MLASLQVIMGQFLHEEAGGWFPSLRLPAPDELLTMQEVSNPITQTWCLFSIDIAMITRWMPCAPVCNIQEEGVIRLRIRGTALSVPAVGCGTLVHKHLGDEMVAEGMKMATNAHHNVWWLITMYLHTFTCNGHFYMHLH